MKKKVTMFLLAGVFTAVAALGFVSLDPQPASARPCYIDNNGDVVCPF